MSGKITPHPVLRVPTPEQAAAMGEAKWVEFMKRREEIIRGEKADPYRHGWEPPAWKLNDALLGLPFVPAAWASEIRKKLTLPRPVDVLLINGGNRNGKSEYAARTVMKTLVNKPRAEALMCHAKLETSVAQQQPLIHKYFPVEWKRQIRSETTYIAYKEKTGFAENSFILPNGSRGAFTFYSTDVTGLEGMNMDIVWCDELVTPEWVRTLEYRIAEKGGKMLITFTPIQGYTATVAMFQAQAVAVLTATGWLLPKDGKEIDIQRQLRVTDKEMAELMRAETEDRGALVPACVPETVEEMTAASTKPTDRPNQTDQTDQTDIVTADGRRFERVPRVMKCSTLSDPKGKRAVVFFHAGDNPYGRPLNIIRTMEGKSAAHIRERAYGIAEKKMAVRFPAFDEKVHVVKAGDIPKAGTNYQLIDPSSGRNFVMAWIRRTPERYYIYREWPGNYDIPGKGVPGPWAIPDNAKPDGKKGEAQKPMGFGLLQYKKEIARLEKWPMQDKSDGSDKSDVSAWRPPRSSKEAPEVVFERFMDSRFANVKNLENARPQTLLEKFADIHLDFLPTPGNDIDEGVEMITDALSYDTEKPVDFFNMPKLLISEECENILFALQTWTGQDGQTGACKDWIDLLRYALLADLHYVEETTMWETRGGGHW